MIDTPTTGFLVIDDKGKASNLLIYTEEVLSAHIATLKELNAPSALIQSVTAKELLPGFFFR